jgi:recombination DNA repair RAD52 pathway protein
MVEGANSMTSVSNMTDEQFERYALEILRREVGTDGLARFLRRFGSGRGDYTRDRASWQKDLTVEQIVASLNHVPERPLDFGG